MDPWAAVPAAALGVIAALFALVGAAQFAALVAFVGVLFLIAARLEGPR